MPDLYLAPVALAGSGRPVKHQLPHLVQGNASRQLGHAAGISGPRADRVLRPVSKAGQGRAVGPNHTDDR